MGQDQSHRNYNFLFKQEITYWETLTKEENNKNLNVTSKYQNDFTIDKTDILASLSKSHLLNKKMIFLFRRWLYES